MCNPKALHFIKKLEKLKKEVAKSGIFSETVSPKQKYLFETLTSSLGRDLRTIETSVPAFRLDRLKVFAAHMKHAKLQQKFELGYYGYTAEFPILFPDHWFIGTYNDGRTYGVYLDIDCHVAYGTQFFFGLTDRQYKHLFDEYNQNKEWGDIQITGRTGRAKFIENLEQFITFFEIGGETC